MNKDEMVSMVILVIGIILGIIAANIDMSIEQKSSPKFVVTDMVQCKGNICNAVLEMDDIVILLPYDSTKVHVGDRLYLTK